MNKLGLLGRNIDYSFSRGYFKKKFEIENLNYSYDNFDIESINDLNKILNTPSLKGFNVTIPYKIEIIPFLTEIDINAQKIGAINTVKILENGNLKGYNTDFIGFKNSLTPLLESKKYKALILGTGGASKAIAYALNQLDIEYKFVSRTEKKNQLLYSEITNEIVKDYEIIINCSPVGTFPNIENKPDIPYKYLNENNILYDLIYNPEQTKFLELGKKNGAKTINGLKMLEIQAEEAFKIWI
jgi:shikimate dehydrogenase